MYSIYKERIEATYTCGLYGMFQGPEGDKYEELTSVCGWNKSWVPEVSPSFNSFMSLYHYTQGV